MNRNNYVGMTRQQYDDLVEIHQASQDFFMFLVEGCGDTDDWLMYPIACRDEDTEQKLDKLMRRLAKAYLRYDNHATREI